jgi:hypothetical protein
MKFLAVSQNRGDPTPLLAAEAQQMADLVARGVVEHVYLKTDYSGAVLILEAADVQRAEAELATLPLVIAHLTAFTVTEIITAPTLSPI